MKHLLLFFSFAFLQISQAQILCVQCYDQNDSIGINVGANNLIINGGFENTDCGFNSNTNTFCPNSANYNCNIANWTCTGGGSSSYTCFYDSTFWKVEEGNRSAYLGNSFCNACSGSPFIFANNDTSCLTFSDCTVTGINSGFPINGSNYGDTTGVSLSQTVSGLIIGNIYILEFWAGGENYLNSFTEKGLFAVDLGFGNKFLTCKPTSPFVGIGTRYLIQFKAIDTAHTIKFTNWGHICSDCTELVLDDVRLYTPAYLPKLIPNCAANINEFIQDKILLSPNPATAQLTITTNSNEKSQIIIYDLLSQKLIEESFTNTTTINTSSLAKGIYLYEVRTSKGEAQNGRVVIE